MHFENVVNAFWNVDNAFQRNEIFIENHFKMDVTKTGNGEWGMGNGEWGIKMGI